MDPNRQPGITIERIVLVEAHFLHRDLWRPQPKGKLHHIDVEATTMAPEDPNAAAGMLLRVKTSDDDTGNYIIDVQMLAMVKSEQDARNFSPTEYVATAGAAMLFPFVREVVANLTAKGRWGPVWIKPFNIQFALANANSAENQPANSDTPDQ